MRWMSALSPGQQQLVFLAVQVALAVVALLTDGALSTACWLAVLGIALFKWGQLMRRRRR